MKRTVQKYSRQAGFTLVELLISMAVFIIIMVIAGNAFNKIVTQSSKYSKMEESNIEGVIGLEIMRHDLEQIGFGLPWGWSKAKNTPPTELEVSTISYLEAATSPASLLNDAPSGIPRAFASSAVLGNFTSAYIALKGATLGRSKASQRWTYIPFHNYSASPRESRPVSFSSNNPSTGDKVIIVTSHFNNDELDHRLVVDPDANTIFHQDFSASNMSSKFLPIDDLQTYMAYGIDDIAPRMPFNRTDFFIKVPSGTEGSLPSFCAPRTGVLYKATVNHADGKYTYIPLLDCVADMQVVLGWDSSEGGKAGAVDVYSSLPKADGSVECSVTSLKGDIEGVTGDSNKPGYLKDSKYLREHLKVIKVYILAQEGKIDPGYTSPVTNIEVGDRIAHGLYPTKTYSLSDAQRHYRWKLYRIVARPKNLSSNQR